MITESLPVGVDTTEKLRLEVHVVLIRQSVVSFGSSVASPCRPAENKKKWPAAYERVSDLVPAIKINVSIMLQAN